MELVVQVNPEFDELEANITKASRTGYEPGSSGRPRKTMNQHAFGEDPSINRISRGDPKRVDVLASAIRVGLWVAQRRFVNHRSVNPPCFVESF